MSEPLAPGFDPVSYREWLEKATSGNESVEPVTRLADGIEAKWLYTKDDALAPDPAGLPLREPFVRGTRAGHAWQVRQENGNPERSKANSQILEDLLGGSTEVTVLFDRAARLSAAPEDPSFLAGRGEGGTAVSTLSDLSEVLDGVLLDVARVALDAGSAFRRRLPSWPASGRSGRSIPRRRLDPFGPIRSAPWPGRGSSPTRPRRALPMPPALPSSPPGPIGRSGLSASIPRLM